MSVAIVGEEIQEVDHCLLALEDVPLSKIRRVFSHPLALSQCGRFLSTLSGCEVEAFTDTAMSARRIREDGDPTQAAVASEEAARIHGLVILKREIADNRENFTRMAIVARRPEPCACACPRRPPSYSRPVTRRARLLRCLTVLADASPEPHQARVAARAPGCPGSISSTRTSKATSPTRSRRRVLRRAAIPRELPESARLVPVTDVARGRPPRTAPARARQPRRRPPPKPTPAATEERLPALASRDHRALDTVIPSRRV